MSDRLAIAKVAIFGTVDARLDAKKGASVRQIAEPVVKGRSGQDAFHISSVLFGIHKGKQINQIQAKLS
ncbi:hypothetical protein D3C81_2292280 [compost metagenome]